jgi:hypothetical protein
VPEARLRPDVPEAQAARSLPEPHLRQVPRALRLAVPRRQLAVVQPVERLPRARPEHSVLRQPQSRSAEATAVPAVARSEPADVPFEA